ncbi:hypothetical protein AB0I60_11670 [Actinosynnema sp. NPDC050436]|uniref:hypothetical protein n=1 Tax=Actinosynnema sp. NPDC050436 TaxID=3155659 RepID=UPI0033F30B74
MKRRITGRRRTLRQVVKGGLPLERLYRAGYSGRACATVVELLLARSDVESSFQELRTAATLNHTSIRAVCRDLEALGHLTIRDAGPGGGSAWHRYLYRLTPEGVAVWRDRRTKLGGSLLHPVREPTLALTKVLNARLSADEQAWGFSAGYSFSTLERVAEVLVDGVGREWKLAEIASAAGHSAATVSMACRDLLAAGHVDRRAELRRDGLPRWCFYRITPEAVDIWSAWFEGDD